MHMVPRLPSKKVKDKAPDYKLVIIKCMQKMI